MFDYKFLKKNATPGSWRRGYEYYQKDMILEAYPEKNFFKGKVKGNYQDFYVTDLIFKKNKVEKYSTSYLIYRNIFNYFQ